MCLLSLGLMGMALGRVEPIVNEAILFFQKSLGPTESLG